MFTIHGEWFAARRKDRHARTSAQQRLGHLADRREQVLAVVEDHEQAASLEDFDKALEGRAVLATLHVDRGRNGIRSQRWVADGRQVTDPHSIGIAPGADLGEVHRQPGLSDTAGSDQREDAGAIEYLDKLGDVVLASQERRQRQRKRHVRVRHRRHSLRRCDGARIAGLGVRSVERRVVAQDLRLQVSQRGRRFQPQLVAQLGAESGVGAQRLRVPASAVQREHVLRPEPLAQRPISDASLQHADRTDLLAQRQPCIHQDLECTLAHLVEAGLLGRQRRVVGELGERRSGPPFQGVADENSGPGRVGRECGPGLVHPPFESDGVDVVGVDNQYVAARAGLQPGFVAEVMTQTRHVALDGADSPDRWIIAVEDVDESVVADHDVAVHEKRGQEQAAA